jgi:AcrR family transcriptional regulator
MAKTRTYELKRRAERQDETRRRIVDAAVALHTTIGPSQTTIQAIAEKAGVTRPTVYAHFPDARSLFAACSGQVGETTPPPDPAPWRAIADPSERLERALTDVYAYYEQLEQLFDNVERDAPLMPVIAELKALRVQSIERARDVVLEAWQVDRAARRRVRQAIGHGLQFTTWRSLVREQGCSTREAVELMAALAGAAADA